VQGTRPMVHGMPKEKPWMPACAGMTETCMAQGARQNQV
jgi:hypothetical protein